MGSIKYWVVLLFFFSMPAWAQDYTYRIGLVDAYGRREYRYYDANGNRVSTTGILLDSNRRTLDLMIDRLGVLRNLRSQSNSLQMKILSWQYAAQDYNTRAQSVGTYIRQANAAVGAESRDAYLAKLQREGVPEYPDMTNFLFDPEGKPYEGRLQAQLKAVADQKNRIDQSRAEIAQSRDLLSNELGELSQSMAGATAYGQRIERQQAAEGSTTRTSDSAQQSEEDLSWLREELNRRLHGGPTHSHQ